MGHVIAVPQDDHREVQLLLPWYAAGTLDKADHDLVDRHLAVCGECQADLARERALINGLAVEEPSPRSDWEILAARLAADDPPGDVAVPPLPAPRGRHRPRGGWRRLPTLLSDPHKLRWVVGAQFAGLLLMGSVASLPEHRPAPYVALGEASVARTGNVVAMFRSDVSEGAVRALLTASGARVVDGPTSAGAFVLDVPGGVRGSGLARLRQSRAVTMAEPIAQEMPE